MPFTNMHYNPDTQEFARGTKNATIFSQNAPYDNIYQGSAQRWLFVCSAGLLRSPTGAALAIQRGINARSCGSNPRYALIDLTANLIMWANKIIFVNEENYTQALEVFYDTGYDEDIRSKAVVLDIPDQFDYNNPELVHCFEQALFTPIGA